MKKIFVVLGLSLLACSLTAEDFIQPAQVAKDSYNPAMRFGTRNVSRDQDPAPEYSFIQNGNNEDFTFLTSSYYDYMPFSYSGHNLNMQPETSQPWGYPAGGWYVTYMRSETQNVGSDRRAYFSYINSDGTLGESNAITSDPDIREGYTSCAVDPYTGDPFAVWHAVTEPDGSYDSHMTYALFHASGYAGSWRSSFILIDNPEVSIPFTGHYDDEFIWPQVWIGPSPEAEHRRVHAYGNMYPSSVNCLYLYADFESSDLEYTSDLDWTVQSFPYLDNMHYNDIAHVKKDMVVSKDDGKVVFFGSVADSLIAFYSDDYGETFTRYTQQLKQSMTNPTNYQTGEYVWINNDGTPSDMYILPSHDLSHYNGVFTDNNAKVQWMSGVNYNSQENIDEDSYWPAYIYPKIFTFDTVTHEFSFYDIDVQDSDPADDHLAVAWDLNDDGEVDEYDDFGWPIIVMSAPSWFFDGNYQEAYFHESNCKMVANGNWLVTAWHDGAKLQNAYHEVEGYDGWVEQPEIAIIISDDGGDTWSDIRYINANANDNVIDPANHYDGNYAPELAGMLPVNISLGDKLEILSNSPGNYHAKLNFVFMDDGDYGSAVQDHGGWTNSPLMYAAIDLSFSPPIPPLNAEFTADILSGDPPLTVNFTDLSMGSIPTSWEWDFDNDGTIDSYEQNPTYIYTEIGFYTVSLTVSDGTNTDTETKVDYITVGDPLIADFEADLLIGLFPLTVNFTDLSTGNTAISWEWDFNNDGIIDSYEQNPTYIYLEEGSYTVSLTASDGSYSDTEIKIDYITVGEPIIADFVAEPLIGLAPLNVQFTDLSSGGLDIILNLEKNANITSEINSERMHNIHNSREVVSWEWDFDNDGSIDSYEQNPTHIYSNSGLYTVSLTVSDGINEDTETKVGYINVGEPIIANFEAVPLFGLAPHNVQFTDLSTGGLDLILTEDKKVIRHTTNENEKIKQKVNSREIVSWEWDFDNDGTIDSYEQNPAHTYTIEGMYTVVLTVSDGINTNTETKVDYITVGLIPPTNLTADLDEVTGEVDLDWNYGIENGFYEDFEDGVADNWVPLEGNWYVSGGSYNVASFTYELSTSYYNNDYSNFEYEVRLRKTSGTEYNTGICFNGEPNPGGSYGQWQNGYILHYRIDGDWTLLKFVDWYYTFIQSWTSSPDLITGMGSWNTIRVDYSEGSIDVYFNDILQGTYYDDAHLSGKVGLKMHDGDISGTAEFDYASLTEITEGYTFGPVSQSKYRDVYSIDSQKENDPDLSGTIIGQELAPVSPHEGRYTYQSGTESRNLQYFKIYRDASVIGTTMDTSYSDDLPEQGTYEYEVTAFYDEGESEPVGPVEVIWEIEPLISDFEATPLTGLSPLNVQFTDLSTGGFDLILTEDKNVIRHSTNENEKIKQKYNSREIVSWEWDFDNDGTIDSYEQNPAHTYTVEGMYTVILTVSDGINTNTETKEDYITVGDPIIADFEADPLEGIQPLEVQFTDLSFGGLPGLLRDSTNKSNSKIVKKENSRDIVSWEWDFENDGVVDSYIQNPIHIYIEEGLYTVSLTVSDGTNEDTEIKVDYITVTPVSGDTGLLPINTQLYTNHPNPFNPETNIQFDIKENETGTLTLFNIKGQILDSHQYESGKHNYLWEASNQASGIYFYRLQTQTINETRKMLLLK